MSTVSDVVPTRVIIELPEKLADALAAKARHGQTVEQVAVRILNEQLESEEDPALYSADELIQRMAEIDGREVEDVRSQLEALQVQGGYFFLRDVAYGAYLVRKVFQSTGTD